MITLYHNPRCSKSRAAVAYLKESGVDFQTRLYLETHLTEEELRNLLESLSIAPQELIRTKEILYKEQFGDRTLSEEEAFAALLKFPKLMERPIAQKGNKAVIARPTVDAINDLF